MKSIFILILAFSSYSAFANQIEYWYCSGKNLSPLANRIISRAIDHMDFSHPEALDADPTVINDATLEALHAILAEGDPRRVYFPQEINLNMSRAFEACRTNSCIKATYSRLVADDFCR